MISAPIAVGVVLAVCIAGPALADPCEAPLPKPGALFSGVVRYVGDGDSLCIGKTSSPGEWVEIRLSDYYAPELHEAGGADAKRLLEQSARGREITCAADHRSFDRIVAQCYIGGKSLGDLLRENGGHEGGRGR